MYAESLPVGYTFIENCSLLLKNGQTYQYLLNANYILGVKFTVNFIFSILYMNFEKCKR